MRTKKLTEVCGDDYITRQAGEKVRNLIVQAVSDRQSIALDFENLMVASTSFFDEGFAKLLDHKITRSEFDDRITLLNIRSQDLELLNALWVKRHK